MQDGVIVDSGALIKDGWEKIADFTLCGVMENKVDVAGMTCVVACLRVWGHDEAR